MKTPASGHYNHPNRRGSVGSSTSPDSRIFIPSITSEEILHEQPHGYAVKGHRQRRGGFMTRKVAIFMLIVVVAVAGAIVAFVVTKGNGSTSASNESGSLNRNSTAPSPTTARDSTTDDKGKSTDFTDGSAAGSGGNAKVLTDPAAEKYPLTAFAIGDWGATTYSQNGSCCVRRKGKYNAFDRHAEIGVSKLMAIEARNNKPSVVMGHGDSFYWTGINGENDQKYRFQLSFEERHGEDSMMDVPWVNVMGNHDYGGGSYICSDAEEQPTACRDAADMLVHLKKKFTLQSTYVSPSNNRWIISDHFYKYTIEKDGVSMDIFNLDTNDAESHGALQICCQCYMYSDGDDKTCKQVNRGHKFCAGGDVAMFDACMNQLKTWADDSRTQLETEVAKSKATWKIVNTHYSPYAHYGETSTKKWMGLLEKLGGLQLWINGHTHGEKHDFAGFNLHFIENGAGGGIQSESASGIPPYAGDVTNVWTAGGLDDGNTYGFFSLSASENWLKVQFMTFGPDWALTKDDDGLKNGKIGSVVPKHCWYIPKDGSKGRACDAAV